MPKTTIYPKLKDVQWLTEKYHEDDWTTHDIADEIGCGVSTVCNWFKEHDIQLRDSGKQPTDIRLQDSEWFRRQYIENELSTAQIAENCGAAKETVREWKRKHGIPSRTEYKSRGSGPDNPNWTGGHDEYGPNWSTQRQKARQRDEYTCRVCGISEDDLAYELDVHHITPRRQFTDETGDFDYEAANELHNLVTMCRSCHIRWERVGLTPM